jgi:methylglutaconyl-CoA hydratase
MATQQAAVKLSEFTIGIGPFVVSPAIERKMGIAALSQLTLEANRFFEASWAREKGLYAEVYNSINDLDAAVQTLAEKLTTYNREALQETKRTFWSGTEHWDTLLAERAAISGRLVLSEFTKRTLKKFSK